MVLAVSCQKDNKTNNKDPEEYEYQFWSFKYIRPDGPGIYADGDATGAHKIFDGGSLFTEKLGEDEEDGAPILHIELKNGNVKDKEGISHTVFLNYTGRFPIKAFY